MRQVRHIAAAKELAPQLYKGVHKHKDGSGHRDDAEHAYYTSRINYRENKQNRIDGAARPDEDCRKHARKAVHGKGGKPVKHAAQQVEEQEFLGAKVLFYGNAEEKQAEHIEKEVGGAPVDEHIGQRLPPEVSPQDSRRAQAKIDGRHTGKPRQPRKEVYADIERDDDEHGIEI